MAVHLLDIEKPGNETWLLSQRAQCRGEITVSEDPLFDISGANIVKYGVVSDSEDIIGRGPF